VSIWHAAWLKREWALHPESCPGCGRGRSIAWSAWCPRSSGDRRAAGDFWLVICFACDGPAERWFAETLHYVLVGESPSSHVREVAPYPTRGDVDLQIWTLPGATVGARQLHDVSDSFAALDYARSIWSVAPGQWSLRVGDDGRLWAPWCPITWGGDRRAEPLPYRRGRLRRAWRDGRSGCGRSCVSCKSSLGDGCEVWRPDTGGRPVSNLRGWDSRPIAEALVCAKCGAEALARSDDDAHPDDSRSGHLRLIREVP